MYLKYLRRNTECTVANVRYVSAVLTELMREFYGNNED